MSHYALFIPSVVDGGDNWIEFCLGLCETTAALGDEGGGTAGICCKIVNVAVGILHHSDDALQLVDCSFVGKLFYGSC